MFLMSLSAIGSMCLDGMAVAEIEILCDLLSGCGILKGKERRDSKETSEYGDENLKTLIPNDEGGPRLGITIYFHLCLARESQSENAG